jgi:hypothetical protein
MGWHGRFASMSSQRPYCCSPFPPRKQLLTAVVGGATVVAAVVQFTVDMEGAWLLAPGPPCEQVLAVAGDGAGALAHSSSPLAVDTL